MMINRETTCKACEGTGMLADDEGWQYGCTICDGSGELGAQNNGQSGSLLDTDANNRLLD